MSIILGIDPGSRAMGYGIIHIQAGENRYLGSGVIRVQQTSMVERLLEIDQNLHEIIRQYAPTVGAIESVFMHQNVSSALKLGQARGVAMVAMARAGMSVSEYAPREVKKSVVGYGAAEKGQVQQMVQRLLRLSALPPTDAADALAIALCHAQHQVFQARLERGKV